VDITRLAEIGDSVYVRDLQLSDKIRILTDPDTMIVLITPPEMEEGGEEAASAEPEVIEKGKKEEEDF
jgi:hypothetical protein